MTDQVAKCPDGYQRWPGTPCFKVITETFDFRNAKEKCKKDLRNDPLFRSRLAEPRTKTATNLAISLVKLGMHLNLAPRMLNGQRMRIILTSINSITIYSFVYVCIYPQ